jgi:hypothetical protein
VNKERKHYTPEEKVAILSVHRSELRIWGSMPVITSGAARGKLKDGKILCRPPVSKGGTI